MQRVVHKILWMYMQCHMYMKVIIYKWVVNFSKYVHPHLAINEPSHI